MSKYCTACGDKLEITELVSRIEYVDNRVLKWFSREVYFCDNPDCLARGSLTFASYEKRPDATDLLGNTKVRANTKPKRKLARKPNVK